METIQPENKGGIRERKHNIKQLSKLYNFRANILNRNHSALRVKP